MASGVLCTAVAYVLFFRLIDRLGPAKAITVTFTIPVFAVFYGVTLLGETLTPWMLLCGVVVLCGTALATGTWRYGAQCVDRGTWNARASAATSRKPV